MILHWTLVACDCWKNGEPLVNMGPKTVFQLCCYGVQSGVCVYWLGTMVNGEEESLKNMELTKRS